MHPSRIPLRRALPWAALIVGLGCDGAQPATGASTARDDLVSRWNVVALEAGRAKHALLQARALAMVHAAIFDAVNGVEHRYTPYLSAAGAAAITSPEAAAAAAAHAVLVALHPEQRPTVDAALAASLARLAPGAARDQGIAFGSRIAAQIVATRAADGSDATSAYVPRSGVAFWQPTPVAHAAALAPHWGQVQPFLVEDPRRFVLPPPPAITSDAYARDFEEVKRIGAKASRDRTPDQTAAAVFWTGFAPQLWSGATRQALAQRPELSLVQRARAFALMSGSLADAFVIGWATKFKYELWRPVTAIHAAEQDGNPRTAADPAWEPLIATPPFPCYVSGHAITSGAAEQALIAVLGTDRVALTLSNPEVGITRRYRALSELANEAIEVRIWGGVHFRVSQVKGLEAGRSIGRAAAATRLRAIR